MECHDNQIIEMKLISCDNAQRSAGFEYEHIFRGEIKCSHCGEPLRLLSTVFEYPKGVINYIDTTNEACVIIDEITKESVIVTDATIENWMDSNSYKSQFIGSNIIPLRPDIGYFINVNGIDIAQDIFKDEYAAISNAYFSVIKKMDEHYKKTKS